MISSQNERAPSTLADFWGYWWRVVGGGGAGGATVTEDGCGGAVGGRPLMAGTSTSPALHLPHTGISFMGSFVGLRGLGCLHKRLMLGFRRSPLLYCGGRTAVSPEEAYRALRVQAAATQFQFSTFALRGNNTEQCSTS